MTEIKKDVHTVTMYREEGAEFIDMLTDFGYEVIDKVIETRDGDEIMTVSVRAPRRALERLISMYDSIWGGVGLLP